MKESQMYKSLATALLATTAALCVGAAQAGQVAWSVAVNGPVVGAVVSNAPVHHRAPVYAPAPVVYVPAPAYRVAPPVAYYPRHGVYYRPVPVAYPRYYPGWRHHGHPHRNDRGGRHD
jgi:hypothetical protein